MEVVLPVINMFDKMGDGDFFLNFRNKRHALSVETLCSSAWEIDGDPFFFLVTCDCRGFYYFCIGLFFGGTRENKLILAFVLSRDWKNKIHKP